MGPPVFSYLPKLSIRCTGFTKMALCDAQCVFLPSTSWFFDRRTMTLIRIMRLLKMKSSRYFHLKSGQWIRYTLRYTHANLRYKSAQLIFNAVYCISFKETTHQQSTVKTEIMILKIKLMIYNSSFSICDPTCFLLRGALALPKSLQQRLWSDLLKVRAEKDINMIEIMFTH